MRPAAVATILAVVLGCCTFALQRPHVEPTPLPQATAPVPPASVTPTTKPSASAQAPPATTEKALDLAKWHLNYANGVLREHTLQEDTHND